MPSKCSVVRARSDSLWQQIQEILDSQPALPDRKILSHRDQLQGCPSLQVKAIETTVPSGPVQTVSCPPSASTKPSIIFEPLPEDIFHIPIPLSETVQYQRPSGFTSSIRTHPEVFPGNACFAAFSTSSVIAKPSNSHFSARIGALSTETSQCRPNGDNMDLLNNAQSD